MPRLRRDRRQTEDPTLTYPKDQPCCSTEANERLIHGEVDASESSESAEFFSNSESTSFCTNSSKNGTKFSSKSLKYSNSDFNDKNGASEGYATKYSDSNDASEGYATRYSKSEAKNCISDLVFYSKHTKKLLFLLGGLALLSLIGGIVRFGEGQTKHRHSLYSGVSEDVGETWYLNLHDVRRRRHLALEEEYYREDQNLKGLALECNDKCTLTLHRNQQLLKIKLFRREFNSVQGEEVVIPIIQYLDSENETRAHPTILPTGCIYTAKVEDGTEESTVNLCDDNGLYGTLALHDGAYVIEPLNATETSRKKRDLKISPHLIYRAQTMPFEDPPNIQIEDEQLSNSTRNERQKRTANSWDYYVEVLVVADYKMLVYHQNNLEAYVLTLFSTVASIYRHASLRASVNIIVVRVVVLKHENVGPRVSNHAQETLQQFCAWQQNLNDRNDDALAHHDVAILLTRHDICRATNKCDTLGLAELGTMCDARKSCAIIEDNGLSAAFTIAHELGHILNIPHDDERRCARYMPLTKNNFHIMAPTLEYNTNPWAWSPCSSAMLEKFLDNQRSQTQCILDKPVERRYMDKMFNHPPAGMLYSVNQQCQYVFGPSAEICPYMPTCRRLWCSTYYGFQMGCRTQHMPWADGTPCGDSMWCHRGQCVGISPDKRLKVDGGWGEWQPFGPCSRTCGGGVQKGVRDCDKPRPMNGGKYCIGQRERYRSCNIHECPFETAGFREVQCSDFDNKNVGIHGVPVQTRWVPKYTAIAKNERCKLYCRAKDSAAFYLLKDKVIDGTPCDMNSDDICIDGICHKAGCDHRLGSSIKRDTCGVCGGDGRSCQTVQGVYNERTSFGYNEVLRIPAGSANIDISQQSYNNHKDDDNYLALRTATGEFLLNGQYQVSVFRQQIPILDTVLEYSGSDNIVERINGTGPIRSDIYVHVLSVGNLNPPHVNYKYMVPLNPSKIDAISLLNPRYYWLSSDAWSQCTSRCQGNQIQGLRCIEGSSNRPVADQYCTSQRPEQKQRMCNVNCFFKWKTVVASQCSARCGRGEQEQRVMCVALTKLLNNTEKDEPAHESECLQANLRKPATKVPCYNDCEGRKWSYSAWSQCSATCGKDGVKKRQIRCTDNANRDIDRRHCELIVREATETECNRIPCPGWSYGQWTECSRSCDGGIRIRHASCHDSSGREVNVEYCANQERKDREKCNEHVCSQWKFGPWSACSTSCGTGVQRREATCSDRNGNKLDESKCDIREKILHKSCHQGDCPHWKVADWSTCSVSCLDGYKTRSIQCVDGKDNRIAEDYCLRTSNNTRPATHEFCNNGPCPYWRQNPWSSCSVSCGAGIRVRTVECVFREQVVDGSFCNDQPPKALTQNCTLTLCSEWKLHPWSRCSKSCGTGSQTRRVECVKDGDKIVNDRECSGTKPRTEKECNKEECEATRSQPNESPIYWATGPWTKCSKACGTGTQRRQVKCRDSRGGHKELPDEYCRNFEKEPESRQCIVRPCVKWKTEEWEPCQGTCGVHVVQKRRVYCTSVENPPVAVKDSDCDPTDQPAALRGCNLAPCVAEPRVTLGEWIVGDWEACSVSCGIGYKRRTIQCDSKLCNEAKKPPQFEHCNLGECRQRYTWQAGQWSICSVSCGQNGLQQRRIWCEFDTNPPKEVAATECDRKDQPSSRRPCSDVVQCPVVHTTTQSNPKVKYVWTTGQWSMCSSTCGSGVRIRDVFCVNELKDGEKVPSSLCSPAERPMAEHRCRQKVCPKWTKEKWSECSVTCGKGIRRREVLCKRGRDELLEASLCSEADRPKETRPCETQKCSSYQWKVTPWSKCTELCNPSEQTRRAYCMSSLNQRAAPRMCAKDPMPVLKKDCPTDKCPYQWVAGPWSTCSKTCGQGHMFRRLECKVKDNIWLNQTEQQSTVLSRMCMSLEKPEVSKECVMNECGSEFQWSVGPWSQCSKDCGTGTRKRKVYCLNKKGDKVEKEYCDEQHRPSKRENCFLRNCLPGDCAELKSQNPAVNGIDGEYIVLVTGFRVKVYCARMNETLPRTYVNVDPKSNYAEFYGKRLAYPFSCPYDGQRNDSCDCTDDGHLSVGKTEFSKVRVDLHNMKINPHDFTFTNTTHGSQVPYGTAGDCYSMSDCPQGRFSIDLRNTGLKVVDDLQWVDHGHRTSSHIERSYNNAVIKGACGGYCGECAPERFKGLVLELEHKLKARKH